MKNFVKNIFCSIFVFIFAPIRVLKSKKLILCYHRFSNRNKFEMQIKWLSEFVDFVTLDEVLCSDKTDKWQVSITFDDGDAEVIKQGLNVFKKYNLPVTVFLNSHFIENPSCLPWWELLSFFLRYWKDEIKVEEKIYNLANKSEKKRFFKEFSYLFKNSSPKRIKYLSDYLKERLSSIVKLPANQIIRKKDIKEALRCKSIEFGGHTLCHVNMAKCTPYELKYQVYEDRRKIAQWTGKEVRWFAYPYGKKVYRNKTAIQTVNEAGYKAAFTTDNTYLNKNFDFYQIPRIAVDLDQHMITFKAKILDLDAYKKLKFGKA